MARRSPPRKVTYFEPVLPRLERGCALRPRARKEQHENRARRCRSSSLPTRPTRRPCSRGSNDRVRPYPHKQMPRGPRLRRN
jgi:hypothetical protein